MQIDLQNEKQRKLESIVDYYASLINKLQLEMDDTVKSVCQVTMIKQAGWEAFEKGESLEANPYRYDKEPDESNYWEKGWELARAKNEAGGD